MGVPARPQVNWCTVSHTFFFFLLTVVFTSALVVWENAAAPSHSAAPKMFPGLQNFVCLRRWNDGRETFWDIKYQQHDTERQCLHTYSVPQMFSKDSVVQTVLKQISKHLFRLYIRCTFDVLIHGVVFLSCILVFPCFFPCFPDGLTPIWRLILFSRGSCSFFQFKGIIYC